MAIAPPLNWIPALPFSPNQHDDIVIGAIRIPSVWLWLAVFNLSYRIVVLRWYAIKLCKLIFYSSLAVDKFNSSSVCASLPAACSLVKSFLPAVNACSIGSRISWNVVRCEVSLVAVETAPFHTTPCVKICMYTTELYSIFKYLLVVEIKGS